MLYRDFSYSLFEFNFLTEPVRVELLFWTRRIDRPGDLESENFGQSLELAKLTVTDCFLSWLWLKLFVI